jgi:HD-like signal output (HDOD) protein
MDDSNRIEPETEREWKPNFEIRFPPLSRTVADVTKLLAETTDAPDTPRLVKIVNSDPVIGAFVLRRINSAYYGMRTRVADIQKACFLLGFEEVCDIVLTAGMMKLGDIFESVSQIKIFERIMEMSLGTAGFNKKLAQYLDLSRRGFAFTTGLIHTVGRLVLLYNRPAEYEALWYSNESGMLPTVTSEQIIFGTDHAELAARTAEDWHLPDDATLVIRNYLTPGHVRDPDIRIPALTLSVSAAATRHFFLNTDDDDEEFSPPAALYTLARQIRVPADDIIEFVHEQRGDVGKFIHSMVDA